MKYEKIRRAEFIERPNRFVALVRLKGEGDKSGDKSGDKDAGKTVRVHVKNTGRCRELLVPGAEVILEDFRDRMGSRKMEYSLIAVYKGDMLINMDSQAPNMVTGEMLKEGRLKLPGLKYPLSLIKPEAKFGDSRLDFYVEDAGTESADAAEDAGTESTDVAEDAGTESADAAEDAGALKESRSGKAFIEVKGVTLEENGIVRFPDAPTERGVKHLKELQRAVAEGFGSYVVFIVQMDRAERFEPNRKTDPAFAKELAQAAGAGVKILAYTCKVDEDGMTVEDNLAVRI